MPTALSLCVDSEDAVWGIGSGGPLVPLYADRLRVPRDVMGTVEARARRLPLPYRRYSIDALVLALMILVAD